MSSRKDVREDAKYELIGERLTTGVEDEYESDMDRGTRLEPIAVAAFEFETGKRVERTGFCEDEEDIFITSSPDGLIGETEALEVKCMAGKNHIKTWFTNQVPDKYYWQVVQYFVVNSKLAVLYFVSYNPDIPTRPLHTIEVKRENLLEDIKLARETQKTVLAEIQIELAKIIQI